MAGLGTLALIVILPLSGPASSAGAAADAGIMRLPPVGAIALAVDTFHLGGFARGNFAEALRSLDSEMDEDERVMVGSYLDRVFRHVVGDDGLGQAGRLRVVYERSSAPSGLTRSVRILGAEAAVGGSLHTAFYHEHLGRGGYFDHFGRSLDPDPWLAPLERRRVSSHFGTARRHPILGRVLPHLGTDYAAPEGTPVRATADGHVTEAGRRGGYGNLVEILHPNGYTTRYGHLSRISAAAGESVRQGDVIGYVGSTGMATGPHLHYELRRRGEAVDPEAVLEAGGVPVDLGLDPLWRVQRERIRELVTEVSTISRPPTSGDPAGI